jgi:hypothetical protein
MTLCECTTAPSHMFRRTEFFAGYEPHLVSSSRWLQARFHVLPQQVLLPERSVGIRNALNGATNWETCNVCLSRISRTSFQTVFAIQRERVVFPFWKYVITWYQAAYISTVRTLHVSVCTSFINKRSLAETVGLRVCVLCACVRVQQVPLWTSQNCYFAFLCWAIVTAVSANRCLIAKSERMECRAPGITAAAWRLPPWPFNGSRPWMMWAAVTRSIEIFVAFFEYYTSR